MKSRFQSYPLSLNMNHSNRKSKNAKFAKSMKKQYIILVTFLLSFSGMFAQNLTKSEYVIISFEEKGKYNEFDNHLFHWIAPFDSIALSRIDLVPLCTDPMFFIFDKQKENGVKEGQPFEKEQLEKSIEDFEKSVRQKKNLIQTIKSSWAYKLDVRAKGMIDVAKRYPIKVKVYATLISGIFAEGDFCYKHGNGAERQGWCHAFIPISDFQVIDSKDLKVSRIWDCIVNMDYSFIDYTYAFPGWYEDVRRFKATQNIRR